MNISFQSLSNSINSSLKHLALNPYTLTGIIGASYISFYTGYDKPSKSLKFRNLYDFFTFSRGTDWSLVEFNKAISLTGLTTLLISFLPPFEESREKLLWLSMNMLWYHSAYSMYKFYGFSFERIAKDKPIKRLSILLGNLGQATLLLGFLGYLDKFTFVVASTIFGLSHFWTMEVDYKYVLQVRPFAYLPFPLGAAALYYVVFK